MQLLLLAPPKTGGCHDAVISMHTLYSTSWSRGALLKPTMGLT